MPHWFASALALNRTVGIVLLSVLLFGLGEQLWSPFLPVYFHAQATRLDPTRAPTSADVPAKTLVVIGVYALALHLFEAFCFTSGGKITGRLGDRGSLVLFSALTVCGYVIFLIVPTEFGAVLGALLILGWEPLSVPVTFTTVGATVSHEKRGLAFALQSIQKRLPKLIGPPIAARVLQAMDLQLGTTEGSIAGMRVLVGVALVLGVGALLVQWRWLPHRPAENQTTPWRDIVRRYPPVVRGLLFAEVFTRWCDWLVREFVVLYVVLVRGVSIVAIGDLLFLQNLTALLVYLPVGKLTQSVGLRPFIGLTFVFFALFPLTLIAMPDSLLWVAFVVNGLREIGEPARKALITTSIPADVRARGVGLYWGIRSVAIAWAGLAGAGLWWLWGPEVLFAAAFLFGVVGAVLYYSLCPRE
jgi:Na+/melibiose symporter-like transporter